MKSLLSCTVFAVSLGLLILAGRTAAVAAGPSYYPTAIGSSWSYNTQALTLSQSQVVLKSGTEMVEVQADGRFKSYISLENGNTITSYSSYVINGQAISVSVTQIIIRTVDTLLPGYWTETTTDNTFAPYQVVFPSSITQGTHETSDSIESTHLTGYSYIPGYGIQPMLPTDSSSQQVVDLNVGAIESVTVPAGTFQAVKIVDLQLQKTARQTS